MAEQAFPLGPVDFDPFAEQLQLGPVDFDPFADEVPAGRAEGLPLGSRVGQNVVEFGKGVTPGAVTFFGGAAKGAAGLVIGGHKVRQYIDELETFTPGDLNQVIELRSRVKADENLTLLDKRAFQAGISDYVSGKASINELKELFPLVTESKPFKAGEAIQEFGRELLPAEPGFEQSVGRQLGEGVGSLAAGAVASLLGGPIAAGALFTLAGAGEAVDRAIQAGATEEQIIRAAHLGQIPGLTDQAPIEILLGRIPIPGGKLIKVPLNLLGKAMKVVGRIGLQVFVEGFQEGGQEFLQNMIAQEVHTPEQDLGEGILPAAGLGGGVGAIAEVGRQLITGFAGRRGARPIPPGEVEKSAAAPPPVTPADEASPIPTDIIAEGRAAVADAGAAGAANDILRRNGLPAVGARVTVTLPDGEVAAGTVADSFTETNAELGLAEDGIKIALDDGGVFEQFVTDLAERGIVIAPEAEAIEPGVARKSEADITPPAPEGLGPVDFDPFEDSRARQGEPQVDQAISDRVLADANLFGDRADADAIQSQGFNSVERNRQQVVLAQMSTALNDQQVLRAIVETVPIDVMNDLVGAEVSTENLLHDPSVLSHSLSVSRDVPVSQAISAFVDSLAPSVIRGATVSAAEETGLGFGPGIVELPDDPNTTLQAVPGKTGHVQTTIAGQPVEVDINPTPAQKEAGSYKKGHVQFKGLDITIETPRGATRTGVGADGVPWSVVLPAHYGYIKGTEGADQEQVDVYLGIDDRSETAFVVDQIDPATGKFDEHKVILGATNQADAEFVYDGGFSDGSGPARRGAITEMPLDQFKEWVNSRAARTAVAYRKERADDDTRGARPLRGPVEEGQEPGRVVDEGGRAEEAGAGGVLQAPRPGAVGVAEPTSVPESGAPPGVARPGIPDSREPAPPGQAEGAAQRVGPSQEALKRKLAEDRAAREAAAAETKQGKLKAKIQARRAAAIGAKKRKARVPKDKGPADLLQFIRNLGGVRDSGGELAAMDAQRDHIGKPFVRKLVNPKGLSLDRAREAAAEAGYLPANTTVSDFLDKISDNLRGSPVYAAVDISEVDRRAEREIDPSEEAFRAEQAERAEGETDSQMGRAIDEIGLTLSPEEIAAAKELMADGMETEDAIEAVVIQSGLALEEIPDGNTRQEPRRDGEADSQEQLAQRRIPGAAEGSRARGEEPGRRGEAQGKESAGGLVEPPTQEPAPEPTTELTPQGPQTVLPGAERTTGKEFVEAQADKRIKGAKAQKPADEDLFDVAGRGQDELFSFGPVNPRFAGDVGRIGANLQARLSKLGIADKVALRLVEDLEAVAGGRAILAHGKFTVRRKFITTKGPLGEERITRVSLTPGLIEVSLAAQDGQWTLDHEVIHALREYELIRDTEWTTLTKAATADTERMARMRDQRKGQGLTEDQIVEEVIADMFADWSVGRTQAGGFLRRAFERIRDFLTALGQALTQRGYASVNDIFGAVESGEVGRRDTVSDTGPMGMSQAFMDESDSTKFPPAPKLSQGRQVSPRTAFDNAETEARWQEARKGAGSQETLARRMGDWFRFIGAGFTRHYIHLPNEARFSEAREQFRKLEAAPQASKEQVIRILRQLTDGMSESDLDLFTRKVVLDDLSFESDEDHDLPFGMSPADVAQELAKVDRILASRDDLKAKLRQRKLIVRGIANQLVDAGVLHREQIKNPAYYRHQVLDYARAQVKYAQGAGKRVRSPRWARRMGSTLDINANLLEAEFEWLHKALTDIATAKTIAWVGKSGHNVRGDVISAARANNEQHIQARLEADQAVDQEIDKQGRPTSPLTKEWRKFRQNIAFGMSTVRKAIEDGKVTNIPREFRAMADGLSEASADNETSLFPFLAWMMDNDKTGAAGAGLVFKAISQRKQWTKDLLGRGYADTSNVGELVKRFAPEGYVAWQPDEGNLLFTAKTIPEHVMDRMLARIAESGAGEISADELLAALNSVRSMLAVGGPKFQMVLPEEIANTLNSIRDDHVDGLIESVFTQPVRYWKQWVLINPRRVLKYNINNFSGDVDAVIAGNPRALRHMPRAIKELYTVMLKGETPSERYREAVERGVFDSGLTVQEIPDINLLSEFEQLVNPPKVTQPGRFAVSKYMKLWRALRRYTQFRENWLRYASYLDYAERLEGGEDMTSIGYGAARKDMVDAIRNDKDRAALLARELVGDYGAISHFGKGIRRSIIPFYSWMEINTKRYWRFGINAYSQGVGQGLKTTGIVGATLGVRMTAYLGLRMMVLYGMVQIWNNLFFGDEEDEMRVEDRVRLHLNLGRDANGDMRLVRFQGALSDFLGWIGFDDAVAGVVEVEKGRATWSDVVKKMAKAPVNKIASGLTPVLKMPLELTTGLSYWPDVFRPRPIRDTGRHAARLFSVENEYDLIFDRPSRGFGRSFPEVVISRRNISEIAYGRIRGMAFDFTRRLRGSEGFSSFNTERSRALHTFRLAKRFGDVSAAQKARRALTELGVTGKDLQRSIKRAHPLGGIPIKHRGRFLRSLTARERKSLDLANRWYRETYLQP